MTYFDFLKRVVDDGIEAARKDYSKPEDALRLKGSLAGFEACRGREPMELAKLLEGARKDTVDAHREEAENYWEVQCREAEIEWVCNVVSAAFANSGFPVIVPPTVRAAFAANRILQSEGCVIVSEDFPCSGVASGNVVATRDAGGYPGSSGVTMTSGTGVGFPERPYECRTHTGVDG